MKPKDAADRIVLDVEKAKSWLAKGAQPTDRVLRFLDQAGVAKSAPERQNPEKGKPGKRAQERAAERAEREKQAAEAAGGESRGVKPACAAGVGERERGAGRRDALPGASRSARPRPPALPHPSPRACASASSAAPTGCEARCG